MYAKAKVYPLSCVDNYSIPVLEFMGVLLALKCLTTLLDAYQYLCKFQSSFELDDR